MRTLLRAVPALVAASLLAACSGTGTSTLPTTSGVAPDAGDFVPMGGNYAHGDVGAIRFMPMNDGLNAIGGRMSMAKSGCELATCNAGKGGGGTAGNLIYGSGPVQTAPKLYVVFWGSSWNGSGDPDHAQAYYINFLQHVGGTSWNNTVTQYTQSGGAHAGNPAGNFGGSYVDTSSSPPKSPSQSQMAAEGAKAAAHFGDYSANAQYIVAMPHGVSPSGFKRSYCAYHSTTTASGSTISWTNMPYLPDASSSCGASSVDGNVLDGYGIVGGHEMAESETDPQLHAWLDSLGSEIGDKCAWVNLQSTNLNGTNFPTQPLWSNASSSCVQSY